MAYRVLMLEIQSAQNLRKVHTGPQLRKNKPFALVSIRDNNDNLSSLEKTTEIDKEGDINPTWNFHVTFNIDITRAVENQLALVVKLKSRRKSGERDVGEVRVQITDLEGFDDANDVAERHLSKDVVNSYGTSQRGEGTLNFSYKFGSTVQHPPASTVNIGNHEIPNAPRRQSAGKRFVKRFAEELGMAAAGVAATAAFGAALNPFTAEFSDQPETEPDDTGLSVGNNGGFSGDANGGGTYN